MRPWFKTAEHLSVKWGGAVSGPVGRACVCSEYITNVKKYNPVFVTHVVSRLFVKEAVMPRTGLSLLGFMDEQQAMSYLQKWSVLPEQDRSPEGMKAIWKLAKAQLGKPFPRPGKPQIQPLSQKYQPYLEEVMKNPAFQLTIRGFQRFGFMLVEIDALLAFQFHILTDESDKFSQTIGQNPTVDEMLSLCLPQEITYPEYQVILSQNGITIRAQDLSLTVPEYGVFQKFPDGQLRVAGTVIGSSPFLQVAQINGRCYLRNGYHRAYTLAKKRATHMPCLFLETNDFAQVGVLGAGATFDRNLLESVVPPTVGYITRDRAHQLNFKHFKRIINVLWNQYEIEVDEAHSESPDNQAEP